MDEERESFRERDELGVRESLRRYVLFSIVCRHGFIGHYVRKEDEKDQSDDGSSYQHAEDDLR